MQEVYKSWMDEHENLMNQKTLDKYNGLRKGLNKSDQQRAHHVRRGAFSAFLFQFLGNKHRLLAAIQYPLCSAAQPASVVQQFMQAWEREKASDDLKKRGEISKRGTEDRTDMKRKAHAARQAIVTRSGRSMTKRGGRLQLQKTQPLT